MLHSQASLLFFFLSKEQCPEHWGASLATQEYRNMDIRIGN
jgi:hypothetical protein